MSDLEDASAQRDLRALQQLQERFDDSRGFGRRDEAVQGDEDRERLDLLQFSGLALCGEAGELANAIKKTARAARALAPVERHLDEAREELADVLAYLLKTSALLDVDLQHLYLRRLCENALRFSANVSSGKRWLSVIGPSGAGKSTVVRRLAGDGVATYVENARDNPHLANALRRDPSAVVASQNWFLDAQERFFQDSKAHKSIVVDQDPTAVVLVYSQELGKRANLDSKVLQSQLWRLARLEVALADQGRRRRILHLDADPAVLRERVIERDGSAPGDERWYATWRERFDQVYARAGDRVTVRTDHTSLDRTLELAHGLLNEGDQT